MQKGDAQHWRDRAEEARAVASGMHNQNSKAVMLNIAKGYDNLAEQEEKAAECKARRLDRQEPQIGVAGALPADG